MLCLADSTAAMNDRAYWEQKLSEAEAELAAAKKRTELNAAAKEAAVGQG
jgi:predicted ATPase